MYRLVIDVVCGNDEDSAADKAKEFLEQMKTAMAENQLVKNDSVKYRLSRDEDRQVRNYLIKNENGHATTTKGNLLDV